MSTLNPTSTSLAGMHQASAFIVAADRRRLPSRGPYRRAHARGRGGQRAWSACRQSGWGPAV